jgi:hypothetical protein
MDTSQIAQLVTQGKWIALFAMIAGFGVRLMKGDPAVAWFPPFVPERYRTVPAAWRPALAVGLGVVSAVLTLKSNGASWQMAIVQGVMTGFVSGSMAIAGHQIVVESMRHGREFGETRDHLAKRSFPPPPNVDSNGV